MENIISVTDLSFSYKKRSVLKNISFSIKRGQAAAIIGDNGSGKSTLLALLAGIISPDAGELLIGGKTAYLPQENALIEELSFEDNLKFFASLAGARVPDSLPLGADALRKTRISRMSGGMKKLCSIVCTLLCDADIYLLDEPCAALDKEHRESLLEYIKELKKSEKTILYVAHDREEYREFADIELVVNKETVTAI